MSTSGNSSNETVPCSNTGCHFWGRANTNNYCSKCFKELDGDASSAAAALSGSAAIMSSKSSKSDTSSSRPRSSSSKSSSTKSSPRSSVRRSSSSSKTSDTLVAAAAAATTEAKSDSGKSVVATAAAGGADGGDEVPAKAVQKNKKRCWECKKKVGYTGIECRCGFIYCGTHRYPDAHKCEFDYKEFERGVLAKNNEKLENEKLGDRL